MPVIGRKTEAFFKASGTIFVERYAKNSRKRHHSNNVSFGRPFSFQQHYPYVTDLLQSLSHDAGKDGFINFTGQVSFS